MRRVKCDYCGRDAKLVGGKAIYPHRRDLYRLSFWRCEPCDAHVGVHKNSDSLKPLGRLANKQLRKWKQAAHASFDPLWRSKKMSRRGAYSFLSEKLGIHFKKCHIGMFDEDMCKSTVIICEQVLREMEMP